MVRSFVVTSPYPAAAMPGHLRPAIAALRPGAPGDPASRGLQAAAGERQPRRPVRREVAHTASAAGSAHGQDGLGEERQAHVVAVLDVHVPVVELLVADRDAVRPALPGQRAGAPVQGELVARAAVDVDRAQLAQLLDVAIHPLYRVPGAPALPDRGAELAGLEVERPVDPQVRGRRLGVGRVVRGHADGIDWLVVLLAATIRVGPVAIEPGRRAARLAERVERRPEVAHVA